MRILLVAAALIALPAATRDRKPPAATPTGKPESCISLRSIRQSYVRSDRVIDFEISRDKVYRNTLPYDCPGLGFEERFSYATSLSELCSTDIITVLHSTSGLERGASCGLGQFQPVTLAPH